MDSNFIPRNTPPSQRVSPQSQSDEESSQKLLLSTARHKVSIEAPSSPRLSKLNRLRQFFGFKVKDSNPLSNRPLSNRKARVVVSSGSSSSTTNIKNKKSSYQRFKDLFRVPRNLFWQKRTVAVKPAKPEAKQLAIMKVPQVRKIFQNIQEECEGRLPSMRYSFYNKQVKGVNTILDDERHDRMTHFWVHLTEEQTIDLRQHLSNMLTAANFSDKSHNELLKDFDAPPTTLDRVEGELPYNFFDTPPTTPTDVNSPSTTPDSNYSSSTTPDSNS